MKRLNVLLLITLIACFSSCKKDVAPSTKELLTSHQWKLASEKFNGVAQVINDCVKDNFLVFASNGTYTANPGTIKCWQDETILTGTWTLSSDEKSMTVILAGDTTVLTIIELTESKVVVSYVDGTDIWEQTFIPN